MKNFNLNLLLAAFLVLTFGSFYSSAMEKPSTIDNKDDHCTPMSYQASTPTQTNDAAELNEENNEIQDPLIRRMGPQTLRRAIMNSRNNP